MLIDQGIHIGTFSVTSKLSGSGVGGGEGSGEGGQLLVPYPSSNPRALELSRRLPSKRHDIIKMNLNMTFRSLSELGWLGAPAHSAAKLSFEQCYGALCF